MNLLFIELYCNFALVKNHKLPNFKLINMKKIFTLIATALVAVSVNAQSDKAIYQMDNKAETYILDANGEATKYTMDDNPECFAVNYINGDGEKMQIKLAANDGIFFEYSNSQGTKNNVFKTGANFAVFDSKNFVINVPLQTDDILAIEFSAKGNKESTMSIYGETPCVELYETPATDLVSTAKDDYKVIRFVATKGGTAKIKETTGGCRLYAIAVNAEIPTGIREVASAAKADKVRKAIVNGRLVIETANGTFSATGARIK